MINYDPLWKILISKDMTKTELREKAGFSTVTLAKLSKNEYVSLKVIDDICEALNLEKITDVVQYVKKIENTFPMQGIIDSIEQIKRLKNVPGNEELIGILSSYVFSALDSQIMQHVHKEDIDTNKIEEFKNIIIDCSNNKVMNHDMILHLVDLLP